MSPRRPLALLGADGLEEERRRLRLRNADGVGQLPGAQSQMPHLTTDLAIRGICGVHARSRAAAMRPQAATRVDGNLAASEASVALWTADDELSGRTGVRVFAEQNERCQAWSPLNW